MSAGSSMAWREAAGDMGNEPDDYRPQPRERCYCGAFLSKEPNESRYVMDQILTWGETEPDEEGFTQPYPLECSWVDEPYWRCKRCGRAFEYDEMYE